MYGNIFNRLLNIIKKPVSLYQGLLSHREDLWVVVSVHGSGFYDNTKYFFSYLYGKGENVYLITMENTETTRELKSIVGSKVVFWHEEKKKAERLLRKASVVIADRTDWLFDGRGELTRGAFTVQLWHGIGLKPLERCYYRQKGWWGRFLYLVGFVEGRWYPYELFISTSEFYTRTWFYPCFFARRYLSLGYPRNDILFEHNNIPKDLVYVGADKNSLDKIIQARKNGIKIILYAPTYRKDFTNAFNIGVLSLKEMNRFAKRHNILWVIKLHPWEAKNTEGLDSNYSHILVYDGKADIQPLLKISDILITDYSSVYFDFLLTNRPVIFFPYDIGKINLNTLRYPYDKFTPGPKANTWYQLADNILSVMQDDIWQRKRERLTKLAYAYQDGFSSYRIWKEIRRHLHG